MSNKQKQRSQKQTVNQLNRPERRPSQQQARAPSERNTDRDTGRRDRDMDDETMPAGDRSSGGMSQQK